jgi:hypothetical protein
MNVAGAMIFREQVAVIRDELAVWSADAAWGQAGLSMQTRLRPLCLA